MKFKIEVHAVLMTIVLLLLAACLIVLVALCIYTCTDHNFEYADSEGNTYEAAFCNWQAGKAYCRLKDGRRVFDVKEYRLKD